MNIIWNPYSYSFLGMTPQDQSQAYYGGELPGVMVTAKRDVVSESSASGGWVDLSGLQLNRYEYSEDGFSDPMNYVKFADNVGVGIWNSTVGLGSAILNAEQTVRDIGDYFSPVHVPRGLRDKLYAFAYVLGNDF